MGLKVCFIISLLINIVQLHVNVNVVARDDGARHDGNGRTLHARHILREWSNQAGGWGPHRQQSDYSIWAGELIQREGFTIIVVTSPSFENAKFGC